MDILDVIKADHDTAFAMLHKLQGLCFDKTGSCPEATPLVFKLIGGIHVHNKAEEFALYASALKTEALVERTPAPPHRLTDATHALARSAALAHEVASFVREGAVEHAALDTILARLERCAHAGCADVRELRAIAGALQHALHRHAVHLEERVLFPLVLSLYTPQQRRVMGEQMEDFKRRVQATTSAHAPLVAHVTHHPRAGAHE